MSTSLDLMLEAKAANTAQHGLDRSDWAMGAGNVRPAWQRSLRLTNALLSSRTSRWVLEKFFGLSSRRRLPGFAR